MESRHNLTLHVYSRNTFVGKPCRMLELEVRNLTLSSSHGPQAWDQSGREELTKGIEL